MSKFHVYDLETLSNYFSYCGKYLGDPNIYYFEISSRRNDRDALLAHLSYLQNSGAIMVGYNSLGFDYPIIHNLMTSPMTFTYQKAKELCDQIIGQQNYGNAGALTVYMKDRMIQQLDLAKLNHFDNHAKRTSLKSLQFAMRSESVEDLPFLGRDLTFDEMDTMARYNVHDVTETEQFLIKCMPAIEMRQELIKDRVLTGDVLNWSDVKLGTEYLISKIGRQKCFVKGSTPKQTFRQRINFNEIILPKVYFRTEEFQDVHEWFKKQAISVASNERPKLEAKLAGLDFHFGVGGVHASVSSKVYESNDTHTILDIDVSGMYVAVAIANRFAPEHLGQAFTDAYRQLQADRAQYPKGTTMNAILKLAGNGVYGNSNNKYSCFFDSKYTFSVTVNGQLQLLQLAEALMLVPDLQIIQANTDGVTVYLPRDMVYLFHMWCREWEKETGLKLEEVEYKKMWIRDVNNYLVLKKNGEVKAKGAYWYPKTDKDYEGVWNKDFSNMVVQKGIEQVLVNGYSADDVVRCVCDPFDFMARYKTTAGAKVFIGHNEVSKTVRYYVSTAGEPMYKVASPKGEIGQFKRKPKVSDATYHKVLTEIGKDVWDERIHTKNKSKYTKVTTSIESGRKVKHCNKASDFNWKDVDYDYYAEEIRKLIIGEHNV